MSRCCLASPICPYSTWQELLECHIPTSQFHSYTISNSTNFQFSSMSLKEPANIVNLGGSYACLYVTYNLLRKTIDDPNITKTSPRYRVVLSSLSTHLFWNVSVPRVLDSLKLVPHSELFIPFLEASKEYLTGRFVFVQGNCSWCRLQSTHR
jgi:hypothetical protein